MGFFDKFFGPRKSPEDIRKEHEQAEQMRAQQRKQYEEAERQRRIDAWERDSRPTDMFREAPEAMERRGTAKPLSTETAIPEENQPEFEADRRIVSVDQYFHGKADDKDMEHKSFCSNPNIDRLSFWAKGMSVRTLAGVTKRSASSWANGGSLVKVNIDIDGRPYVVIGRSTNLVPSEGSQRKDRRADSHDNYLLVPAEEWSVGMLLDAAEKTRARHKSMQELQSLEKCELTNTAIDEELPENWFTDELREILTNLITGHPVSIIDTDNSVEGFAKKIFHAQMMLPASVGRRMSFGAGVGETEGWLRLAFGGASGQKDAHSVIRHGSDWTYPENTSPDLAKAYITLLEEHLNGCKTPRDVMKAVSELPESVTNLVEKTIFGS